METSVALLEKLVAQNAEIIELLKGRQVTAEAATLQTAGPQIVYSISLGNLMEVLSAPAVLFQPEFLERLQAEAGQIVVPKKKTVTTEIAQA